MYLSKRVFESKKVIIMLGCLYIPVVVYTQIIMCINRYESEGISLYKEIELPRYHTPLDLKKKSKEVFRKFHPDKQNLVKDKVLAGQIFAQKTAIVSFLQDVTKKNIYDKFGLNLSNDTRDNE